MALAKKMFQEFSKQMDKMNDDTRFGLEEILAQRAVLEEIFKDF